MLLVATRENPFVSVYIREHLDDLRRSNDLEVQAQS